MERLTIAVDDEIGNEDADEQHDDGIDEFDGVVDGKVGGEHDEDIEVEGETSVGNFAVLGNHQYDDVGTAGIAAVVECERHA